MVIENNWALWDTCNCLMVYPLSYGVRQIHRDEKYKPGIVEYLFYII